MKPYYQDKWVTLYHGDCRDMLPRLDVKVDLIPTSPPYNCRKAYPTGDEWAWPDYYDWMREVLENCYQVMVDGGVLALNVPGVIRWQADHAFADSWSTYDAKYRTHRNGEKVIGKGRVEPLGFRLYLMMQDIDYHIREPIVWVKGSNGNAIASDYKMGCDSDPYMRPVHELILLGSKGQWFHRGGTGRRGQDVLPSKDDGKDVWFITPSHDNGHPAIFPETLPMRLIPLFTHATDAIILDPFLGSGTTCLAAKKLLKQSIGIEIDERYCEMAANRCRQEAMELAYAQSTL